MKQIVELNDDPNQNIIIIGENGEEINFTVVFKPTQNNWVFDLTYEGTTINGARLCNMPNILRSYKNIFPFGIWCFVNDGDEPFKIDDFSSDRVILYLLNTEEVTEVEQDVYGEIN